MKTLNNLICLDNNIKVYIPGTINMNQEIDNSKYVDIALNLFSGLFGGSNKHSALKLTEKVTGTWISNKELIKEKINIVESYCTEKQLKDNISEVIEFCEKLKYDLNQEAISLEVNNKLYLI